VKAVARETKEEKRQRKWYEKNKKGEKGNLFQGLKKVTGVLIRTKTSPNS